MDYTPPFTLRAPQRERDRLPIKTPVMGYNNLLGGYFDVQTFPNIFTNVPRLVQTANQNYIGRKMIMPETQNYDGTYQPKLQNVSIPLDEVPLRNVGGIQRPMFSVY